ncbi:5-formyltetrahydrofolate cyclo-ligase [Natronomonas sp. EA1]|uniref:5-formyltetrahydrofolate cyclo-ligase n=1 Tax=Natronomonas sp. EA1 TaxID=3421655 RepID=UPI003EB9872D
MDKQALREQVWDALEETGEARFPFPPHGRIPNFNGAREAAERLAETEAWQAAEAVKSNPDAPQLPVRRAALHAGKTVYMAVPRLRDEKCFLELDPARLEREGVDLDKAATIGGSSEFGVPVLPSEMPHIDLILAGSVAVSEAGGRIGKGEGYSDMEWAVLAAFENVSEATTVATTVHELQLREGIETDAHDVPLDLVVTPERVVRTGANRAERPRGIDWDALSAERIAEIPILERLRQS